MKAQKLELSEQEANICAFDAGLRPDLIALTTQSALR